VETLKAAREAGSETGADQAASPHPGGLSSDAAAAATRTALRVVTRPERDNGWRSRLGMSKRVKIASLGILSRGSTCGSRRSRPLCGFRRGGRVYDPATQSPPIATPSCSQCGDGCTRPTFGRTPQRWRPLQTESIEGFFLTEPMVKLSDEPLRALLLLSSSLNGCCGGLLTTHCFQRKMMETTGRRRGSPEGGGKSTASGSERRVGRQLPKIYGNWERKPRPTITSMPLY
jgi:hypothetical protein